MGRIVVIIVLVVLAVWAIRKAIRASAPPEKKNSIQQQDLVRCARCGVHLPRSEARLADGRLFCGDEHARLGAGGE